MNNTDSGTELIQRDDQKTYYASADTLRVICVLALIILSYGLPIPYFELVRPFFSSATGILFTLYGFFVLRDGEDLRKNIKHAAKVFLILFVIYGLITMGYLWFFYRKPFMYFNKRGIFNFIVLNFWGESICGNIWYVQSVLYALVILWLLRRFKKYDWLLCAVLFVIAVLVGELSEVINFSFLGNDYIPGNFFTRTIPYMLLGRLLYGFCQKREYVGRALPITLIVGGLVLSAAEYLLLQGFGKLGYMNHFIGFIPIAAGACLLAVGGGDDDDGEYGEMGFGKYAGKMYKPMFFVYDPLYYVLLFAGLFLCRTKFRYYLLNLFAGPAVAVICFGLFYLCARISLARSSAELSDSDEPAVPAKELGEFEIDVVEEQKESFGGFENAGERQEKEEFGGFENAGERQEKEEFGGFENAGERQEKEEFGGFTDVGEYREYDWLESIGLPDDMP